jgi:hypothetical protein
MVTLTIKVSVSFANFVGKKTLAGGVAATETSETEIRKIGYCINLFIRIKLSFIKIGNFYQTYQSFFSI